MLVILFNSWSRKSLKSVASLLEINIYGPSSHTPL
jgi:hypothetical protein